MKHTNVLSNVPDWELVRNLAFLGIPASLLLTGFGLGLIGIAKFSGLFSLIGMSGLKTIWFISLFCLLQHFSLGIQEIIQDYCHSLVVKTYVNLIFTWVYWTAINYGLIFFFL